MNWEHNKGFCTGENRIEQNRSNVEIAKEQEKQSKNQTKKKEK